MPQSNQQQAAVYGQQPPEADLPATGLGTNFIPYNPGQPNPGYYTDPEAARNLYHPVLKGVIGFLRGGPVGAWDQVTAQKQRLRANTAAIQAHNAQIEENNRILQDRQGSAYMQMQYDQSMIPEQDQGRVPLPYMSPYAGADDIKATVGAYRDNLKYQLGQHQSFKALQIMEQAKRNAGQPVPATTGNAPATPMQARQAPQQGEIPTPQGTTLQGGLQAQYDPPMVGTDLPVISPDVYRQHSLPQSSELGGMWNAASTAAQVPSQIDQNTQSARVSEATVPIRQEQAKQAKIQTKYTEQEILSEINLRLSQTDLNKRSPTVGGFPERKYSGQLNMIKRGIERGNINPNDGARALIDPDALYYMDWKPDGWYKPIATINGRPQYLKGHEPDAASVAPKETKGASEDDNRPNKFKAN